VFLVNKNKTAGNTDSSTSDNNFGLPNTAIMLGSLQQEFLDLKGTVGSGDANLSDMVSGGFENIGAQLDAQTAAIQSGFGTLQDNLIANQNSNTSTIIDNQNATAKTILQAISDRADALGQLISDNAAAQNAVNQSFAQSLTNNLDAITAQHNAEMAAIGALGDNVSASQSALISQITNLSNKTNSLSGQVSNLSTQLNTTQQSLINQIIASTDIAKATTAANSLSAKNPSLAAAYDKHLVFSDTDKTYYYASGGHLFTLDWWFVAHHFQGITPIHTGMSLSPYSDSLISDVDYTQSGLH
jgi:hypothetical protein